MKKTAFCIAFAAAFLFVAVVQAEYRVTSLSNVDINDSANQQGQSLYELFNNYFGLSGDQAYASSNDLFADRGTKETVRSWTVGEGGEVFSSFRNADYSHDVYGTNSAGIRLYDGDGNSVFSMIYNKEGNGGQLTENGIPIPEGEFSWAMDVYHGQYSAEQIASGNLTPDKQLFENGDLNDGEIHLLSFNVSDLISEMLGQEISAYLFAWEDISGNGADYDFQDFAYILTNVTPNVATPEPATALIFGAALIGLPFAYRRMRRNKKA